VFAQYSKNAQYSSISDILNPLVDYRLQNTNSSHIPGVVSLQRECFPEPFPIDSLWQATHIENHLQLFPEGQFVVTLNSEVIASCTNMLISLPDWQKHEPWEDATGGLALPNHNPAGTVLYGIDISVHPSHRNQGLAKILYNARFDLVKSLKLTKYGTVCRIPDFHLSKILTITEYVNQVLNQSKTDRTLTPLLRMGLTYTGIIENYMHDEESGNAGVILEWTP